MKLLSIHYKQKAPKIIPAKIYNFSVDSLTLLTHGAKIMGYIVSCVVGQNVSTYVLL
jgi:hypothetical protein